ncbi:MAG: MFS transporter [Candidatus Hodarchaeales archaeon]|jgi:MFS family permease
MTKNISISRFLGIEEIPTKTQDLMRSFLWISILRSFFLNLSSTFLILHIIDNIGFAQAGIFSSIILIIQVITDYPSGALGDWLGQKTVVILAYLSHGLAFLLLNISISYFDFVLVAIIIGFANAQSSGALETWVDNNYKYSIGENDPERKTYGFSNTRIDALTILPTAIAFIFGGILSTIFSRQFVFLFQGSITIIFLFLMINLMTKFNFKENKASSLKDTSFKEYFSYLTGGINLMFSSKITFFFIVGLAVYDVWVNIWMYLLLFPIFFNFAGTDALASGLRTIIWLAIMPLQIYMAKISKKLSNQVFPIALFFHPFLLLTSFIILLSIIPSINMFNIFGLIAVFLISVIINGTVWKIVLVLRQRNTLDLIPSKHRNSVYSLMPTLVALMGIIILPIAGFLIEEFGLIAGILSSLLMAIAGTILTTLSFHYQNRVNTG